MHLSTSSVNFIQTDALTDYFNGETEALRRYHWSISDDANLLVTRNVTKKSYMHQTTKIYL